MGGHHDWRLHHRLCLRSGTGSSGCHRVLLMLRLLVAIFLEHLRMLPRLLSNLIQPLLNGSLFPNDSFKLHGVVFVQLAAVLPEMSLLGRERFLRLPELGNFRFKVLLLDADDLLLLIQPLLVLQLLLPFRLVLRIEWRNRRRRDGRRLIRWVQAWRRTWKCVSRK